MLDCLPLPPPRPRPRPGSTRRAPSPAPPRPLQSRNKQPGSKGQNQTLFIKKILYRKKFYAFRWTVLQRNSLTVRHSCTVSYRQSAGPRPRRAGGAAAQRSLRPLNGAGAAKANRPPGDGARPPQAETLDKLKPQEKNRSCQSKSN